MLEKEGRADRRAGVPIVLKGFPSLGFFASSDAHVKSGMKIKD
jgi:hypothetical protein